MDHAHGRSRHLHVLTRRPALFGGLLALVALLLGLAGIGALLANPIVTVQLQGTSIPEGNSGTSTATFTVNLSQALGAGQQIVLAVTTDAGPSNQATAGASCGSGVDYVSNSATLTFNPGDVSQTFAVTICGDTVDELNESFVVRVTVQSSNVATVQPPVGQSTEVVAIITDDDNPTVQSISAPSVLEHAGPLNFVVTLSAAPIENVVIAYSTGASGDTATATTACPAVGDATQDYVGVTNGTLVIPAGQPTGTIAIQVCDDAIPEPPGAETMTLVLDPLNSFSVNLPFGQSTATGTIQDSNAAPTIPPSQTFNVDENSAIGTAVSPAPGQITVSDPDGPGTTFTVTGGTGQGLFTVNATSGAITTNQVFDFETSPTSYTLTVQVCDGGTPNRCASGTVTININDVNDPPVVTGATFSIAENSAVGTNVGAPVTATDADMPAQTLSYSITAGNTGGAFAINASTGQITVNGALDYETLNTYTLTVQVCDDGMPSQCGTGTVTINVTDVNEAPVVTGATFSIAENSAVGTNVGAPVTATDADVPAQTLSYSITAGNTGGAFAINASTGQITVAAAVLDYETTPTYTLTVQVCDDGTPSQCGTGTVTINVTDVNEAPVVTGATFSIAENSAVGTNVGTPVAATDADVPAQTLSYSITAGNTGGAFAINTSTGQITVAAAVLDYETTPTYTLTVQVCDDSTPSQCGTGTVTINVTDVNEAPVVTGATFSIAENSAVGTNVGAPVAATDADVPAQTLSYSITAGNTGGAFAINTSTGQITVAAAVLDYETTPTYTLTVQVCDDGTPSQCGTGTVTINVTDANDPPVVTGATFSIAENSAVGTNVGTPVAATDADVPAQTLSYSITAGNTGGAFAINASTGQITVAAAVLDYETTPTYTLTVQVCDDGTPSQCGTGTVTINVLDQNEAPPAITSGQSFNVAENSANGTAVGTVAVTDPDGPTATRTFTITAPAGAPFAISSPGGEITVNGTLDYENLNSYTLSIQVCDGGTPSLCGTGAVTVNVTDVNEPPTVDLNGAAPGVNYTATYTEQAAPTTIVDAAADVTDPDTTSPNNQIATLTATITDCEATESLSASSGTWNAATCTFTVTGPLSTAAMSVVLQSLSYASTSDTPPDSRTITVVATDNGTPQQTSPVATITLNITPVDDPPTLINNGLTVGEGQSAAISAAALQAVDPDTPPANLSFTLTALPARGELRLNGVLLTGGSFTQANINAGQLVYTHDGSETTSDSFSFTLSDGTTTLPVATFTITITPENDDPVLTTSPGATPYVQGQPPVVIDPGVTVTDADSPNFGGGSLSVTLTGGGSQDQLGVLNQGDGPGQIGVSGSIVRYGGAPIGSLSVSSGGPLVVLFNASATPDAVQALTRAITFAIPSGTAPGGPRTATFIVSDGAGGNSAPATKVIDANLLPLAVNDTQQVVMNTPSRLAVLANDSDPDGDPLTITAVGAPGNGSVQIIENGQALRYTPGAGYQGPDSFTYTISDGRGGTATATVNLTVERARILLPYIHDRPVEPDLVVDFRLVPASPRAFMPARVEVTVTNRGRGPASNFWVDFYVNPREAPTVNQPWNELCRDRNCRGIAWFYEGTLRPGESVILISTPQSADNPNGYQPRYTIWDGFFENGSYTLYAYVDSWNRDSSGTARDPRGAIAEENEDNNRAERQVTVEVDR